MSTQTLTSAPPATWQLDPVHSRVGFEVPYLAGTFKGEFRAAAAELSVEDDRGTLTGTAQVASVDVKDEHLAAHLQSPEFFDSERYPELRFESTGFRVEGDELVVDGELTIKGITSPVHVTGTLTRPIVDGYGNERLGLDLSATVDRTEFGLAWNMPLPSGEPALANDVTIVADLQFVKAA